MFNRELMPLANFRVLAEDYLYLNQRKLTYFLRGSIQFVLFGFSCFAYAELVTYLLVKKWANPGLFFVYFWSFQTNNTILQQINVKNVMSIQYTAPGFEPATANLIP